MSSVRPRRGFAETAADSADPRLRGRTYAIPFEDVWQAARRLAGGGLARWSIVNANDHDGVINVSADALLGAGHDVMIHIRLDEDAQTRVDMCAAARKPGTDLGRATRQTARFFRALDRTVAALNGRSPTGRQP